MQFATIPEQNACKSILIRMAATAQVPHAHLFIGPVGSSKLALALAFAAYLNCNSPKKSDACGSCSSCASMSDLTHPDFLLVFPKKLASPLVEAQSDIAYLEAFRNLLKANPFLTLEDWSAAMQHNGKRCQISKKEATKIIQQLSLKPFMGPYKIVLIWLPEYLHHTAANALLKTLEEPPSHSIFLLVTTNSEKILPTIRSRTHQHIVPPFSEKAIEQLLRHKYKDLDEHRYKEVAFLAEGSVSKAFELVHQSVEDNFERFSHWMRSCYSGDFIKLVAQSESFYKLSSDAQKNFFTYALQLIRVTLLGKLNYSLLQTNLTTEVTFTQKFGLNVSINQLKRIITNLVQAYHHLERNANPKIVYAHLSIQISTIFRSVV